MTAAREDAMDSEIGQITRDVQQADAESDVEDSERPQNA